MKLLFISDIHGSYHYGKKIEEIYEKEKPDQLVLLGDLLYHGARNPLTEEYSPKDLIPVLNKYRDKVMAVRGNCDSEVDQMVLDFDITADYSIIFVDGLKFFITHGHIYNESKLPKGAFDVMVHGHTHIPVAEKKEHFYLFNPGSITLPKGGHPSSYGVYENREFSVKDIAGVEMLKVKVE
ncbi:phosphodiesterase YfcE [Andreesenia angusta]|uniref:Phosphoesterase n=1 Tax=Andreesenia angusta TaxID=39480 RepID=A0A1S1V535_9FIRM|nr:phosphodiesterase [Andreesenia angusta]OHW61796.1 phosphodiesterase YfcE [Andreesenia angusta]